MSAPALQAFTPQAYQFNPTILREYDIRGQIDKNLSAQDAFAVGCAFGTYVRRKGGARVIVGYDGRASSPVLAQAMVSGLTSTGLNVDVIGVGPTPMMNFAVKDTDADAGVMITGSHNPADYNGFKMTLKGGPVYGAMIQELGRMAAAGDFETGQGAVREIDVQDRYVARLLRDVQGLASMKIAWDCGNGAGGEIIRRLVKQLPGEHILLFDEIDGRFPNHHPDPTVDENLADLIQVVRAQKCDLGVAFDGDADRVGAVDEHGTIMRCDTLMVVYARDVLARHPGATIVGDVKCSQVMFDEIARLGGKPLMWKTGHSLIKAKMAEEKSPLAGELSGHIFFGDGWYGFDDGIYCAVRLLQEVSKARQSGHTASSLIANLPPIYNTPEIRFEVDEARKFDLVDQIVASVKAQAAQDASFTVHDIDGVRVESPQGWWLIRASNTQNVIVTRAEGNSAAALEALKAMVQKEVKGIGYDVNFSSTGH
ncbi:MAG TPA: phosphomannomutase/phosphoglucomutase [Micavibrio sp.]